MSVDLSQFHQVFFEESFEGLQVMESGLLELDCDAPDAEAINSIFRAAHSIKGSSGTFGFTEITEFTHVLETLLDQVRDGERNLTPEIVDLLLRSVDCLSSMMSALQENQPLESEQADALVAEFNAIMNAEAAPATDADTLDEDPTIVTFTTWEITFKSDVNVLRTGNEPLRMFRELGELGELSVICHDERLPPFAELTPESCYLDWTLTLYTDAPEGTIKAVFEWVEDDCEILLRDMAGIYQKCAEAELVDLEAAAQEQPAVAPEKAKASKAAATARKPAAKPAKAAEAASIRVSIDKIDNLVNLVGELVITQSMLGQLGAEGEQGHEQGQLARLQEGLAQLEHNTRELQESVMGIRMLPISFTFSRFPRLVRDLSKQLGKHIELRLVGEQTELDKTVMEKIGDPLVHLVRNALDHGIEMPEERIDSGKNETGLIELKAFHQGGSIVIEITDDGRGLNRERIKRKAIQNGVINEGDNLSESQVLDLIFQPGFSTAEAVTDVSGRGVGMDVVRRNIQELNGTIEVSSQEGFGSVFSIRLPLTLAILDGQLIRVGSNIYIVPLTSIVESLQPDMDLVHRVAGGCDVFQLRDEYIPIIRLYDVFDVEPEHRTLDRGLLVVVEAGSNKVALVVDELLGQQQVVIKSMESNYRKVEGISGATILGDGTVSLILEITDIIRLAGVQHHSNTGTSQYSGAA